MTEDGEITLNRYNERRRHVTNATYIHVAVLWLTEGDVREKEKDQVEILGFIEARGLINIFFISVGIRS